MCFANTVRMQERLGKIRLYCIWTSFDNVDHDKPDPEKKKDLKALEDIVESVRLSCKELIML